MDQIGDANEAFHKKKQLSELRMLFSTLLFLAAGVYSFFILAVAQLNMSLPPGLK